MEIRGKILTGILSFNPNLIVLFPNIYITNRLRGVYERYFYITIEFKILFFSMGIKFEWENKNMEVLPELKELYE